MSVSFECVAHVPSYSSWLAEQDWTPAYRRHRRNLRLIGLNDTGRRWVLKNPSHLFALDALLEVYPDALIVQTHRSPRTAMASMSSLAAQVTAGWSDVFTGATIGRDQLELWSRGLDRFREQQARHDPARFFDVRYDDFVRDLDRDGRGRLPPFWASVQRRRPSGDEGTAPQERHRSGQAVAPVHA